MKVNSHHPIFPKIIKFLMIWDVITPGAKNKIPVKANKINDKNCCQILILKLINPDDCNFDATAV